MNETLTYYRRLLGWGTAYFLILFIAMLTADIPVTLFDELVASPSLAPSQWVSVGTALTFFTLWMAIFQTRRVGPRMASRSYALAWLVTGVTFCAFIVFLAPRLQPGDIPPLNYLLAVPASWLVGITLSLYLYDIFRGGIWWRAPIAAYGVATLVQTLLYFGIGWTGASVPVTSWFLVDFALKLALGLVFLALYALLRRRVRPTDGLGGGYMPTAQASSSSKDKVTVR